MSIFGVENVFNIEFIYIIFSFKKIGVSFICMVGFFKFLGDLYYQKLILVF